MTKPKIFIASSSESLSITKAISSNLDHDYEVTPWSSGSFTLSSTTISELVSKSSTTDFAIFVFQPDDLTESRGIKTPAVRDNVLFELGLFIGAIGVKRCFMVKPRGVELKLPSDLLGLTLADYDSERSDKNYDAALLSACYKIETAMKQQGCLNRASLPLNTKAIVNPYEYKLSLNALKVLSACLETHTRYPEGKTSYEISESVKDVGHFLIPVQLVKLERLSLIERTLQVDRNDGSEYYSYKITDAGIDKLLENEDFLMNPKGRKDSFPDVSDFSDDIPF